MKENVLVNNNYKSSVRYLTYRGTTYDCPREDMYKTIEFSYQKEEFIKNTIEKEITNNHTLELKI